MSRIPIHHSTRHPPKLARLMLPALAGAVALAFAAAPGTHAQPGPITPAEDSVDRIELADKASPKLMLA